MAPPRKIWIVWNADMTVGLALKDEAEARAVARRDMAAISEPSSEDFLTAHAYDQLTLDAIELDLETMT